MRKYIAPFLFGLLTIIGVVFVFVTDKNKVFINFEIEEYLPETMENGYISGPIFRLVGTTEDIYSCLMPIHANANVDTQGRIIRVDLRGNIFKLGVGGPPDSILEDNDKNELDLVSSYGCSPAIGPATLREELNLPKGEYVLEIYLKPITDKYKVIVTNDKLRLEPIRSSFSRFTSTEILRTPLDIIAVHCFRYKYGCEKGETPNELCPILYNEVTRIATPIADASSVTVGALGRCSEDKLKKDECRFYRYDGNLSKLEAISKIVDEIFLPHGRTAECRDGAELYNEAIITAKGLVF